MNSEPIEPKRAKILIVDDNPKNLSVLGQLLRELNYKCEFALSGAEALKWIEKEAFDLILLDVVMPEMDGYEVCSIIKSKPEWQNIPIIFITIKDDIGSTVKGFEMGAVDYINKPFNSDELNARISTQVELKKSRDQLKSYISLLENKNKYIMDSIHYSQHIQKHILPDTNTLSKYFSDQFIIYKPKQIVSGDFYWFKKVDQYLMFSVADCTGHGVPGAIMSMAAYTALNQAVNEYKLISPAKILNYANKYFLSLFYKTDANEIDDGMDISVCVLDTNTNKLTIGSSMQKVYLYQNGELETITGDFHSIGESSYVHNTFTEVERAIKKGDRIYMQSDGIFDQFHHDTGRKFGSRRYVQILKDTMNESLEVQKETLCSELETWKGSTTQLDDIAIWGIKY